MKIYLPGLITAVLLIGMLISPADVLAQQTPGLATPANKEQAIAFPNASAFKESKLSYKITQSPGNSFGYDIYVDGRLMIRQATVPALPGNEGFRTKKAAESVAALVIEKIKKGQMPPTVEIDEMKKLKAIH